MSKIKAVKEAKLEVVTAKTNPAPIKQPSLRWLTVREPTFFRKGIYDLQWERRPGEWVTCNKLEVV